MVIKLDRLGRSVRNLSRSPTICKLERRRQNRDAGVETMTPEQVTAADQAREAFEIRQAQQIQQAEQARAPRRPRPGDRPTKEHSAEQERARRASEHRASHPPNERGHGIGM